MFLDERTVVFQPLSAPPTGGMLDHPVVEPRSRTRGVEQPSELTSGSLWNEVAGRLRGALNDSTYRTWFGEVKATEERDALVLAVPNDFTREWIEGHFLDLIRAAARDASGRDRVVRLVIDDSLGGDRRGASAA